MKKILLMIFVLLCLIGCSNPKPQTGTLMGINHFSGSESALCEIYILEDSTGMIQSYNAEKHIASFFKTNDRIKYSPQVWSSVLSIGKAEDNDEYQMWRAMRNIESTYQTHKKELDDWFTPAYYKYNEDMSRAEKNIWEGK